MARRIGRRMFLQGAGGVAVGIPFLSSLLPREAAAQAMPPAKRFIAVLSCSGQINRKWYPTVAPAGYRLTDAVFAGTAAKRDGTTFLHGRLPEDPRYGYAPLTDFRTPTGISEVLNASLNPYLPKMTLLRGVDFLSTTGHNSGSAYLGNYHDSTSAAVRDAIPAVPTIDEVMAYSSRVYSTRPARRALHLVTGWPGAGSATDYGMAGGPVESLDGENDPRAVWQALFMGLAPTETPRTDPNLAFLNAVHGDFARLVRSPRISAQDRQLLDRHVAFLADIETGLRNLRTAPVCTRPAMPPSISTGSAQHDPTQLRMAVSLLVDMAAAAALCDLTRVITLNVTNAAHDGAGTWQTSLHNSANIPSDWHHYAHDAFATESSMRNLVAINRWVTTEVFARLLSRLDVPEAADGSTALDHSLVLWGNELSLDHYNITMPTVLAGSAGGAVRTNRYIDYCKWQGSYANPISHGVLIPGLPHNRLMVTCMQAMGLRAADYERGGVTGYGSRRTVETPWAWNVDDWDLARIADPLPGVLAS